MLFCKVSIGGGRWSCERRWGLGRWGFHFHCVTEIRIESSWLFNVLVEGGLWFVLFWGKGDFASDGGALGIGSVSVADNL